MTTLRMLAAHKGLAEDRESLRELLSAAEAAVMAGVGKRTWWRYCSSGRAPQPVRLGSAGRTVRWRRTELAEWIAAGCPRVAERNGGER